MPSLRRGTREWVKWFTNPIPLLTSPVEGGGTIFTLPFKGRARVGMGRRVISHEAEIQAGR